MNKKLMILGASLFQVPLIKKAKQMGCTVITVDYSPENIGHRYSDHYVNCSTLDKDGVLNAAREIGIDGIVTFASDIAVDTVAYIGQMLGLKAVDVTVAKKMTNKISFRQSQKSNGISCPDFFVIDSEGEFNLQRMNPQKKYIIKPVDSSGSRGIAQITNYDRDSIQKIVSNAQSYSRNKSVIAEEFIDGFDVTGEGFVVNNKIKNCFFTRKICNGFIPVVHLIPSKIQLDVENFLITEAEKLFQALGYHEGPFDFDAKISRDGAYIIEASPRLGGNGVPLAISQATDNDYLEILIKYSLGQLADVNFRSTVIRPAISRILSTERAARINKLPDPAEILSSYPNVKELHFRYKVGDIAPPLSDSSASIGYAVFIPKNIDAWKDEIDFFEKKLDMELEYVD